MDDEQKRKIYKNAKAHAALLISQQSKMCCPSMDRA